MVQGGRTAEVNRCFSVAIVWGIKSLGESSRCPWNSLKLSQGRTHSRGRYAACRSVFRLDSEDLAIWSPRKADVPSQAPRPEASCGSCSDRHGEAAPRVSGAPPELPACTQRFPRRPQHHLPLALVPTRNRPCQPLARRPLHFRRSEAPKAWAARAGRHGQGRGTPFRRQS